MSATREGAIAYLSARLNGESFTEATELKQNQALCSASDVILPYFSNASGIEAEHAVYEQALWLLGARAQLQAEGVTAMTLSGISESYDTKGRPSSVAPSAWKIIKKARRGGAAWLP